MKLRIVLLAASAAMMIIPAGAQAGPRDALIDALAKCTDIHDATARLACFDRNTPTLRALANPAQAATTPPPPAEPPKAVALAAPPPAATQPPPKPAEQKSDDSSWLSGWDPFAGGPSKPTAAQMAYQPMGQEILPVTIGVKDFFVASDGSFTVTLANGQMWRSRHGYETPPRFREGKVNKVMIDHAMLGGYNLTLLGQPKLYKVERVK